MKNFVDNQRGEGLLTLPFLVLVVVMVLFIGVDFMGLYLTNQKLRVAATETLTLMKIDNGYDEVSTYPFFKDMLTKVGLEPTKVSIVEATPITVQRGELVTLEVSTEYEVRSIKPILRSEPVKIPIKVRLTGLAQTYIR